MVLSQFQHSAKIKINNKLKKSISLNRLGMASLFLTILIEWLRNLLRSPVIFCALKFIGIGVV